MKFTKDTTLEHMPDTRAGSYCTDAETHIIFFYELLWYVVSFNEHLYCTNASSYMNKKDAWRLFIKMVNEDL